MKLYRRTNISFICIFICTIITFFSKSETDQTKHAIIFDLTNVIIKENQIGFAKKIGYGRLANYAITHWKSPGYRCLDMLAEMSKHELQKPHITITLQSRVIPRCLVELQEGKKNCEETKVEIAQAIELLDT